MRERAGSTCMRSHSHDGMRRSTSALGWTHSFCVAARTRRALAVEVDERAETGEGLLAGHLLLDDRGHQRLEHPVGAAQAPVGVAAVHLGEHRVARLEAARVVVGPQQPRHRAERPVGARTPRLGHHLAETGQRLDHQRGRPGRRTDAAPVARPWTLALDRGRSGRRTRGAAGAGSRPPDTATTAATPAPDTPPHPRAERYPRPPTAHPTTFAAWRQPRDVARERAQSGTRHRAGLQQPDVVRRLPAARPAARGPAAPERPAAARRAAVHRPAPDLRAVAEAARPRAPLGPRPAPHRRPLPRAQAARARQAHPARAHRPVVGARDDDAVGVRPDPALPGDVVGVPVGAVPRGRVPPRQQERRHGEGLRP